MIAAIQTVQYWQYDAIKAYCIATDQTFKEQFEDVCQILTVESVAFVLIVRGFKL